MVDWYFCTSTKTKKSADKDLFIYLCSNNIEVGLKCRWGDPLKVMSEIKINKRPHKGSAHASGNLE